MAVTSHAQLGKCLEELSVLHPSMRIWVQSNSEIAFGRIALQPEYIFDLSSEKMRTSNGSSLPTDVGVPPLSQFPAGRYAFVILGKQVECSSLRALLQKSLVAIEQQRPGMLKELTKVKPRTKRIVAQNANDLFERPDLVKDFADKLMEGWWYGTNNSASETKGWLVRACEFAKLEWGKDFQVSI